MSIAEDGSRHTCCGVADCKSGDEDDVEEEEDAGFAAARRRRPDGGGESGREGEREGGEQVGVRPSTAGSLEEAAA